MTNLKKAALVRAGLLRAMISRVMAKRSINRFAMVSAGVMAASTISAQAMPLTEAAVQNYAAAMSAAANSKNINKVASLVSDDALISLSRKGKTTSLDKEAYLRLLQNSWHQTQNYQYDISINNIVTSGEQAKADVKTVERWSKDGQKVVFITSSRATLGSEKGGAILLRSVSQVTIN